jgi:hypothetical protein
MYISLYLLLVSKPLNQLYTMNTLRSSEMTRSASRNSHGGISALKKHFEYLQEIQGFEISSKHQYLLRERPIVYKNAMYSL